MNKIFITIIAIIGLSLNAIGQSKLDFCKKWNLEGYIYWGISFSPEDTERNDYLNFKEDGTFVSIDEGKLETGTWKWEVKTKTLHLYESNSNQKLLFEVIKVTNTELILLLKDQEYSIKLKFLAQK